MNFEIYCSGMFDQRVVIEQLVTATDEFGQALYGPNASQGTWSKFVECWAKISPIWGQELRLSSKEISESWVMINLRYGSSVGMTPGMRVRHKKQGTIYDIRTIGHVDSARKVVELTCLQTQ